MEMKPELSDNADEMLRELKKQRLRLMNTVHEYQKEIDRMDYLIRTYTKEKQG